MIIHKIDVPKKASLRHTFHINVPDSHDLSLFRRRGLLHKYTKKLGHLSGKIDQKQSISESKLLC